MKRVFLISQHLLFSSGLETLLGRQNGIEIAGQESDPEQALARIQELAPDVVIVDSNLPVCDPASIALDVFRRGIPAKVIGLNLQDNTLTIYRKEQRMTHHVEDFMQVIADDAPAERLSPDELSALATARSRVYGFLGAVYSRMPDDHFAASLSSPEMEIFLSALEETGDAPEDMREGLRLIEAFIRESKERPVEDLKTDLAVERTRLVRGIKPGYGPPPPYEGVYAPTTEGALGRAMMDVKTAYAEAGVVLPEEIHDQPDFIGFELDFMRHLTKKEAQAWLDQNHEEVMSTIEQERAFLDTHILRWIPHYADLMLQDARLDFYRGIARLTKGFVQGDAHTAAELADQVQAVQAT